MKDSPIKLLKDELLILERNLEKSEKMLENCIIDDELHETHIRNLAPKIEAFKQAIYLLENQQEMYIGEEMKILLNKYLIDQCASKWDCSDDEWFEQNKKKSL